jgi:histidinol-phosphate aminotransferase
VFLCSPNNPTGGVDEPETLVSVLEAAEAVGALLVIDEAYGQFAPSSALQLVAEDLPLVVSRTFSKTWSAAALRLGYLVGPTWVVSELEKVVLPYHLDAFKQIAGVTALEFGAEMDARVAMLVEERGRVAAALAEMDVDQWPSGANFILFRPHSMSGDELWQGLVDRGVLVRNCASWPGLKDCLRVTLGVPEENSRFLSALKETLEAS